MDYRGGCPAARVIILTLFCCRNIHAHTLAVFCRGLDTALAQFLGNLCRAVAGHTKVEDFLDHRSGLVINNPAGLIIRGFLVAVRRIGAERLTRLALCLEHRTDFLAGVLGIKLVENVDERGQIAFLLIGAVHTVVDGDEADIRLRECYLGVEADLQVITTQAAHVLDDDRSDAACIHLSNHALEVRSVEGCAAVPVIYKEAGVAETIVICVFL